MTPKQFYTLERRIKLRKYRRNGATFELSFTLPKIMQDAMEKRGYENPSSLSLTLKKERDFAGKKNFSVNVRRIGPNKSDWYFYLAGTIPNNASKQEIVRFIVQRFILQEPMFTRSLDWGNR